MACISDMKCSCSLPANTSTFVIPSLTKTLPSSHYPVSTPLPSPPLPSSLLIRSHNSPHLPFSLLHLCFSLPLFTGPMCAPCSRSWGPRRSTSARVGTGTKAPSAARRRKSLSKGSQRCKTVPPRPSLRTKTFSNKSD